MLPTGTMFLSYCAGPEELQIFRLLDGRLTVHRVAVKRETLRRAVRFFRLLLTSPGYPESWIRRKGQELAGWLLEPALPPAAGVQRILVCPDGPLHLLPFAALPWGDDYLVERNPVSRIISATLWAETRPAMPPSPDAPRLLAFGDPAPAVGTPPSLPASRREVERICDLFGDRARSLLGEAAAEAAVRRAGEKAALLHFACHGILDESVPLDSRLILAASPDAGGHRDDGLLQAWEILEDVRLDADLVVLSACQSGLGAEVGGEGLVGLTRAFHYAGARSVLSSLWSVADDSTAWLMEYLYEGLRRGEPVGDALRAAQVRCIRSRLPGPATAGPNLAHPFYWAGFVLSGAWR
jgi:CHAT domain-containing protein